MSGLSNHQKLTSLRQWGDKRFDPVPDRKTLLKIAEQRGLHLTKEAGAWYVHDPELKPTIPSLDNRTSLYRHYNETWELLYIGISSNPYGRTGNHKSNAAWFYDVASIKIEWFESREEASEIEKLLIQTERPKFNVAHSVLGKERDVSD